MNELGLVSKCLDRLDRTLNETAPRQCDIRISKIFISLLGKDTTVSETQVLGPSDLCNTAGVRKVLQDHLASKQSSKWNKIEFQMIACFNNGINLWIRQQTDEKGTISESYGTKNLREFKALLVSKSAITCNELFTGCLHKEYEGFTRKFTETLDDFITRNMPQSFVASAAKIRLTTLVDCNETVVIHDEKGSKYSIGTTILHLIDEMNLVTLQASSLTIDVDIFMKDVNGVYLWVEYKSSLPERDMPIKPALSRFENASALLDNYRIFKSLSNGTDDDVDASFLYGRGFVEGALMQRVPARYFDHLLLQVSRCNLL
jgi:hypothetical protein